MQWVLWVLSPKVERQDIKVTTLLLLVPRLRMITAVHPLPIYLHGEESTFTKIKSYQIKKDEVTGGS
jgi:hypothetical protein